MKRSEDKPVLEFVGNLADLKVKSAPGTPALDFDSVICATGTRSIDPCSSAALDVDVICASNARSIDPCSSAGLG